MNYAYLGDRLSTSASENFPVLIADLCARAEVATITEPTRSLLENRHPSEHDFPSSSRCSITRPTVCSGAGTGGTATPSARRTREGCDGRSVRIVLTRAEDLKSSIFPHLL